MNVSAAKLQEALDQLLSCLPAEKEPSGFAAFLTQMGQVLTQARGLDPQALAQVADQWEAKPENPLFNELGRLLRRFHDGLADLPETLPAGLAQLDPEEVGSMTGKLRHVLELTDQAANRTLDLSEEAIDALNEENGRLQQLREEVILLSEERSLTQRARKRVDGLLRGLDSTLNANAAHQRRVQDILLTQDYQDLSGQLIHKMLDLMGRLEQDLGALLERYGQKPAPRSGETPLKGPLAQNHQERHDQTDVDSLLDQFGF